MTDESRPPDEVRPIVKQSHVGNPAVILADDKINKILLGQVMGYAHSVSFSNVPDPLTGEIREVRSLLGTFEATPIDPTKARTTSSKLGLPVHMIGPICDYLEENEEKRPIAQIAFDIGVERAKNPAGYSWYGINLLPDAIDPLVELRAKISATRQLRLAGPSGKLESLAPPAAAPKVDAKRAKA